jgi:leader peptidase (prepilin peptidase)/N-methyltransferase
MSIPLVIHLTIGCGIFLIGSVVGSFLNVCIYRIPLEKSVIWPSSRCPRCLSSIAAIDNVPIVGWLALRGECRRCGLGISRRYPIIELMVALLFAGAYLTDVAFNPTGGGRFGDVTTHQMATTVYHLILIAFLVVIGVIDAESKLVFDSVTVPGMILGVLLGTIIPDIRPVPSSAVTMWGGFQVGMIGLLVGGGLVWVVRFIAGVIMRREAMGYGDIRILALIGAFLGWQAAVLAFFIAPFFGLPVAIFKIVVKAIKRRRKQELSAADGELPFGPCLGLAALSLMYAWPWAWDAWGKPRFEIAADIFWSLLGNDPG